MKKGIIKRGLVGKAIFPALVFLASSSHNGTVYAEGWFWQPSASVFAEQNDNVRLSTTDPESAASVGASVSGSLNRETQDTKISIAPSIRTQHYSSSSDLDSTTFSLRGLASQAFQRTEIGISGNYIDSTALSNELEDSGNLRKRVGRTNVNLSPYIRYRLTPISSVKLGAGFTRVDYEKGVASGFNDYEQSNLEASYEHALTRRIEISGTVYQNSFSAKTVDNEAVTHGARLGVSYKFREDTTLNGSMGAYVSDTEYATGSGIQSDTTRGASYDFGLTHKAQLSTFSGSVARKIRPSSTGEIRREDRLSLGWNRKLTQRLEGSVDATFLDNTYLNNVFINNDRKYRSLGVSVSWHLDPLWTIRASYRNAYQKHEHLSDSADSNRFNVSINFNGLKKTIR